MSAAVVRVLTALRQTEVYFQLFYNHQWVSKQNVVQKKGSRVKNGVDGSARIYACFG